MKKVYILLVEDFGIMINISTYSTEAKALKALKSKMRIALKSCTMTAEEKRLVQQDIDKMMAYDIDFDDHVQHAYIVESEVQ